MAENGKKAELRRITGELERYIQTYCACPPGETNDFVDEKCNDAALMLREALDNLERT